MPMPPSSPRRCVATAITFPAVCPATTVEIRSPTPAAARYLSRALSRLQGQWDVSSLSFSDIRLIIHADLALGGWHMRVETLDNGPIDRHVVVALVRTNAGWGIVATPWQDDHILGLP